MCHAQKNIAHIPPKITRRALDSACALDSAGAHQGTGVDFVLRLARRLQRPVQIQDGTGPLCPVPPGRLEGPRLGRRVPHCHIHPPGAVVLPHPDPPPAEGVSARKARLCVRQLCRGDSARHRAPEGGEASLCRRRAGRRDGQRQRFCGDRRNAPGRYGHRTPLPASDRVQDSECTGDPPHRSRRHCRGVDGEHRPGALHEGRRGR
mmetsp:Transcript_19081/g.55462  ORF Transcript_19081/g.55462 Transcript_19081/m.55462 type:complete len:206 (+) Transcript_19081:884-1501(+)